MKTMCVLVAVLSLGHTASAQDFNSRLVQKLSEILNVPAPTKLTIELLPQKELLEMYRKLLIADCMKGQFTKFIPCSQSVKVEGVFIHGYWVTEKDKGHLHIQLHRNAGIDALVHEFCHWYLHNLSNGFLNTHEVLEPLVTSLLVSPSFIEWLEKEQK